MIENNFDIKVGKAVLYWRVILGRNFGVAIENAACESCSVR
jgi:hypothetical protein